jgi:cytochrome c-type biogenesis protein CcmH/NrfG
VRKDSLLFLAVGFAIGFGILYFWTGQHAPQIVRAIPEVMDPREQTAASETPPPPLDAARLRELEDRVMANPQDFDALVELGNMQFDQRNYADATGWYAKALQIRPENPNVRTDMATTMFYAQNFDGAIQEFSRALEIEPSHPQALFNIGVAYLHGKNDPDKALEFWEKLVATNPTHPQAEMVKQQIAALRAQKGLPAPEQP